MSAAVGQGKKHQGNGCWGSASGQLLRADDRVRGHSRYLRLESSARVAHLIEKECGVPYHPGHALRILRQLGWSCQRPTGRALERDEEKIRRWKRQRWPEIKKKPKKNGGPSSSSTKAD